MFDGFCSVLNSDIDGIVRFLFLFGAFDGTFDVAVFGMSVIGHVLFAEIISDDLVVGFCDIVVEDNGLVGRCRCLVFEILDCLPEFGDTGAVSYVADMLKPALSFVIVDDLVDLLIDFMYVAVFWVVAFKFIALID